MSQREILTDYLRRRFPNCKDSVIYQFTMWLIDVSTPLDFGMSKAHKLLWKTIVPNNDLIEPIFSDIRFVRWLMLEGEPIVKQYDEPAKTLDNEFVLHKYLGKGAYGYVVSGTYREQQVALKQFIDINRDTAPRHHDHWHSYAKECAILSMAGERCSEITGKLYGSGWYGDKWCMVLELHQMRSLAFRTHELCTPESIKDVVCQLFSAIDTIHREVQYIHGDIKPDNVMIDFDDAKRPRVKIIDFGLARPIGVIDDMHQYLETIYWRAPELLAEETCDLVMTDVWATAVTALDIITGKYSIHELGAKNDSKPSELYRILMNHCLLEDAHLPEEWSQHIPVELLEFAGDIFKRYLVFVEERAGLKDLPL